MKTLIVTLIISLMLGQGIPVWSKGQPTSESEQKIVQHLYLDQSVENIIILCDKSDFKKEVDEFRDFRCKYGLFWTGIITGLTIYAYTRSHH